MVACASVVTECHPGSSGQGFILEISLVLHGRTEWLHLANDWPVVRLVVLCTMPGLSGPGVWVGSDSEFRRVLFRSLGLAWADGVAPSGQ